MVDENVIQSTKSVLRRLDALKLEHEEIFGKNLSENKEDVSLVQRSIEMIELGITEGEILLKIVCQLNYFESEKEKLEIQVKRLSQENAWLRDELGATQKKFHECEQTNAALIVEIEDLKFLKNIQFNENVDSISNEIQNSTVDLFNDLFSGDEHDEQTMKIEENSSTKTKNSQIPARLKTLHDLVIQYASEGRYEIAVPLCRQTLADLERTMGHQHPDVATMLNILALVYRDQSKYKEATDLLTEALIIREKTLGFDHPAVASTLNNLAVLYGKRQKYEEAESFCRRALKIREKNFGFYHPDVGKQLNNLALICQNLRKFDQVEKNYKMAIEIYEKLFGPHDENSVKIKMNLAAIYCNEAKYVEAEQIYQEILRTKLENSIFSSSSESKEFSSMMKTLNSLLEVYRRQGRNEIADKISKITRDVRSIDEFRRCFATISF